MLDSLNVTDALAAAQRPNAPSGVRPTADAGGRSNDWLERRVQECFDEAACALADDLADDAAEARASTDPKLRKAVDGRQTHYAPARKDFAQRLETLASQLGDDPHAIDHAQARALLQAAGVPNLFAAHGGSALDAAVQSLIAELPKTALRVAGSSVSALGTELTEVALGVTRTAVQAPRSALGLLLRQTRSATQRIAFMGRGVPADLLTQLRVAEEKQLRMLVRDLELLRRQHPDDTSGATDDHSAPAHAEAQSPEAHQALIEQVSHWLQLEDGLQESADALSRHNREVKKLSCITPQTRARVIMAFATLAVDVAARLGMRALLAGSDADKLASLISLVTHPAMSALTKGVDNLFHTRALAGQLVHEYRQASAEGQVSDERLQAWSQWAQDHFETAAQARFHRRDEQVFEPALQDRIRRIAESDHWLGRERQLAAAQSPEHLRAIQKQHQVEDRIHRINRQFEAGQIDTLVRRLETLGVYADTDDEVLSSDDFKLLVCNNAPALLQAQARQDHDPQVRQRLEAFRSAFHDKCGQALSDDDLMALYKARVADGRSLALDALPDSLRPAQPGAQPPELDKLGLLKRRELGHERSLLKRRQKVERKLQQAQQQVSQLAAAGSDQDAPPQLTPRQQHRLADRVAHARQRIQALESQQQQARTEYQRIAQDVAHYRQGEAGKIDPDGYVAEVIGSRSFGLVEELQRKFTWPALVKAARQHLGTSVVLPVGLTATAEAGRQALREMNVARRAGAAVMAGATDGAPTTQTASADIEDTTRAARLRRSAPRGATPAPVATGWKPASTAARDSLAERIRAVLAERGDEDSPALHAEAARDNDLKLAADVPYDSWTARLRQAWADSQQTVDRLGAQHAGGVTARAQARQELAQLQLAQTGLESHVRYDPKAPATVRRLARIATLEQYLQQQDQQTQTYLKALHQHQDLQRRLETPEQHYLDALPSAQASNDTDPALRPLAEFRAQLGTLDVPDTCFRLGHLPQASRPTALRMMLDRVDESGRVALVRHLALLPGDLPDLVAESLLTQLGSARPSGALGDALAALPHAQWRKIEARLGDAQRQDIAALHARGGARQDGSALVVTRELGLMFGGPASLRPAYVQSRLAAWGGRDEFSFLQHQGEPLALIVRAINSLPAADRAPLAQRLIEACMRPARRPGAEDLRVLRSRLESLQGVDRQTIADALTQAVGRIPDEAQRLQAYEDRFSSLCRQVTRTRTQLRSPAPGIPERPVEVTRTTYSVDTDSPGASLRHLMALIPRLPAHRQAEKFGQLADWVRALKPSDGHDVCAQWAALVGQLQVGDTVRADLLVKVVTQAAEHYQQDHIGRTLQAVGPVLEAVPPALARMTDGEAQLKVLDHLIRQFELRVPHYGMQTGLNTSYAINRQATEAHFGRLLKCLDVVHASHQPAAVERLADAIRQGRFDTAGNPNGGAAGLRLQHFQALADRVAALPRAMQPDAMDRLLSHAFGETEKDLGYARRAFREWSPRVLLVEAMKEFIGQRPDGLDVKQEAALFRQLATRTWLHAWDAADTPTGQLMRRILADLQAREKRQLGVDTVSQWIQHGLDSATGMLSGIGGPKSGRTVAEGANKPLVVLDRAPTRTRRAVVDEPMHEARAADVPHAPPATDDAAPAGRVRVRRMAQRTDAPPPATHGWKPQAPGLQARINAVLHEVHMTEPADAAEKAAKANAQKLQSATTYEAWRTRLQQEIASSTALLQRLGAQHDAKAGQRARTWAALQDARMRAPDDGPSGFFQISYPSRPEDRAARSRLEWEWSGLRFAPQNYAKALREHQDLLDRLQTPEKSFIAGLAPALQPEARKALQPLMDFRDRLGTHEVVDCGLHLGLLPQDAQQAALGMLLARLDDHGRVALMRHLLLLPEASRGPAAESLLDGLGTGQPDEARAAALAVLPEPQRGKIRQRLTPEQLTAVDTPSTAWPDRTPMSGASATVMSDLRHIHSGPEHLRDAYLSARIRARGAQAGFDFAHDQGAPVTLFVKAINARPAASRDALAADLVRAVMQAHHRPSAQTLQDLRTRLAALQGVDGPRLERELTQAIGSLQDPQQRIQAYDNTFRQLCQSRTLTQVVEDPFAPHPAFNTVREVQEYSVAGPSPSASLQALMQVIPQLPPDQQATRFTQLTEWVRALGSAQGKDVLPQWAALAGRLKVNDAQRARLLESVIQMARTHYTQDHIGRTLQRADAFLGQMPGVLKGMSDGREQLRVLRQLTEVFDLRTDDMWMGPGLNANYRPNEEVTRAHFARLGACVASIVPASQAEAVEHLARAIRRGSFDTAGCPNSGATRLRLDHFKALAGQVSRLAPAQRPDAMERLLSQAFPRTRQPMNYQREAFQPWETRNLFQRLVDELLQTRPDGLDVAQEGALLRELSQVLWPAEWQDTTGLVGGLMRRIDADLKLRADEQQGVDTRDTTIMRAVDSATNGFSGIGGPKKVPASLTPSGRPVIDMEPHPVKTPSKPPAKAPRIWTLDHIVSSMNSELPHAHPLRVSLEKLQKLADKPVSKTIWRMMDGQRDVIQKQGLKHVPSGRDYPPGLSDADRRLADIINHTGGTGGSAGAALSFSENRNVPFNFKRQGQNNVLIAVDTAPAPGETHSGFRSAADILVHDGVRLANAGAVSRGTLAKAIRKVFEYKEEEVFNVNGWIAPERILPPDSKMPAQPGANATG